jgi:hypothetical protein
MVPRIVVIIFRPSMERTEGVRCIHELALLCIAQSLLG